MSTNTFIKNLDNATNFTVTENGALSHKHLDSKVYELFALGAAYRQRTDEDCILLFKNAFEEDESLALKCLFYLRDIRGGQGERRFFRTCYKWLAKNHTEAASRNLKWISEYGRFDDILYALDETPLEEEALHSFASRLLADMRSATPSLCAKWTPSLNASSAKTKRMARKLRNYTGLTSKEYRIMLSTLRERINVLERLMSANEWDQIEFDKIPSRAGLIYKNAFERRDLIADKYKEFVESKDTKVNAGALYPYEVVAQATRGWNPWSCGDYFNKISDTDRQMIEKYWNNLPDYLEGKPCKMMCVVDTSGSMCAGRASAPINVAISLGMYCAERIGGPFKDNYISFSSEPQFIHIEGVDFVDKVRRIYKTNLCDSTDLVKTFELLKEVAKQSNPEDIPDTIVVISDMEIDAGVGYYKGLSTAKDKIKTEMEQMRDEWEADGLVMPKLVYWNVESRNRNSFLDDGPNVTYVSGFSPVIFKQVLTGKSGYDLMIETLINSKRYDVIG